MSEKKLAKVFYADVWGLRKEKYNYLFGNDARTTQWQELELAAPYYFFVPKDFSLQAEYEKFWKVTEIFKECSTGVKTHRDHFLVGFSKEEIVQRLRVFTGNLPDDLVKQSLNLKDTRDWKLKEAREKAKKEKITNKIYPYAYRGIDYRLVCYELSLIDRGCDRWHLMRHMLSENLSLATVRKLAASSIFNHVFISNSVSDMGFISSKTSESCYLFPLYLYPDEPVGASHELPLRDKSRLRRISNFTTEFLQAIKESIGSEPTPEEIFYYIYAILYSPTYRKKYEEFLKIDFPRVPLPSDKENFKKLSNLGKELVELHLFQHTSLDKTDIGFPKSGSNKVEKVLYDESNLKVFLNKEQYFEGVSKEVWEYRIGAYQVMDKYLKDRKGRKLSLDEINHYMKMAKAIRLTIEMQGMIDMIYKREQY